MPVRSKTKLKQFMLLFVPFRSFFVTLGLLGLSLLGLFHDLRSLPDLKVIFMLFFFEIRIFLFLSVRQSVRQSVSPSIRPSVSQSVK
jgi:hypothetical protein